MTFKLDEQVLEFVKTLSDDDKVLPLLIMSVGRILNKMKSKKMNWRDEAMKVDLRHVAHWLEIAVLHDDQWLQNKDHDGRPKKLLKFSNLEGVLKEANKAIIKRATETPVIKIVEGDEKLDKVLDDGWYVVRLLTPAALDNESAVMQHCVGHGIYDKLVGNGEIIILSLRDRHNKPHVTIEVKAKDNSINQIRGKQNERPKAEYARKLRKYIKQGPYRIIDRPLEIGLIVDDTGEIHDIDELPNYLSIKGNLDLNECDLTELPEYLEVSKDLMIEKSSIRRLPKGLKVAGNLKAAGSKLEEISANHGVEKSIDISRTCVKNLPNSIVVDGDLDITATEISCLPDEMLITGDLIANNTLIRTIPASVIVGKNLRFDDSKLECFEKENIYVGGSICLRGCMNFKLPKFLTVEKSMFVEYSNLYGSPEKIEIGKNLFCHRSNMGNFKEVITSYGIIVGRRASNDREFHAAIFQREELPNMRFL